MTTLSAQITQDQADEIIIERLSNETKPYCIYAQKEVQTEFEITTSNGETIELDYPTWVYYVSFTDETNGKYLIVKESNGNVLEVNTKNDAGPDDLENWRIVGGDDYPIEIPLERYFLAGGVSCQWIDDDEEKILIINSDEELENYINCSDGNYQKIDFSEYTLLLTFGLSPHSHPMLSKFELFKNNIREYTLNLLIDTGPLTVTTPWVFAFIAPKIFAEELVVLHVTYY